MVDNKEECKSLVTAITKILETVNKELGTENSMGSAHIGVYSEAWSTFEKYAH